MYPVQYEQGRLCVEPRQPSGNFSLLYTWPLRSLEECRVIILEREKPPDAEVSTSPNGLPDDENWPERAMS